MCAVKGVVEVLAVLVVGTMVGSEFAVAAFLHPIVGRLPGDAFHAARAESSRLLGKVMPFWYAVALVLLVLAAVLTRHPLIVVAAGVMATVLLLTVTALVPINNRIAAWSDHPPAEDSAGRDLAARWDRLHWLRVALLAVLFGVLVLACR